MKPVGHVTYNVQQFVRGGDAELSRSHWQDCLCTGDRAAAYAKATSLGNCRVHEFEQVKVRGRVVTRERPGSPFRVDASAGVGVQSGGVGVQSAKPGARGNR